MKVGESSDGSLLRRRQLVVAALGLLLLALWLMPLLDQRASDKVAEGMDRAMVTYAVARTLNGVISTVQEATVAVQPGGVGLTLAPGQILDPINDTIEQFSTVMLAASVSLAIQRILIAVGSQWLIAAALIVAGIAAAMWFWVGRRPPRWLLMGLFGLGLIRCLVPLVVLGSEFAFQALMRSEYDVAQSELNILSDSAPKALAPNEGGKDDSLIERAKRWWSEEKNVAPGLDRLRETGAKLVDQAVRLVAVFVLHTVVVPLALLWFFVWAARRIASSVVTTS